MSRLLLKRVVVVAMALMVITPVLAFSLPAMAEVDVWGNKTGDAITNPIFDKNYINNTGLGNEDPRDIAATVINVILGFLGIIAVVIILLGGFKWMTAGGNEDKVGEAKKLIVAGIIGLIIILASFAIAKFVLDQLLTATNAT